MFAHYLFAFHNLMAVNHVYYLYLCLIKTKYLFLKENEVAKNNLYWYGMMVSATNY